MLHILTYVYCMFCTRLNWHRSKEGLGVPINDLLGESNLLDGLIKQVVDLSCSLLQSLSNNFRTSLDRPYG